MKSIIELEELCEQKQNIFDHIFYEFWMYEDTFFRLKKVKAIPDVKLKDKRIWINVLLESHATHLRNLLHFFSGKDSITANTVFEEKQKLGISEVDKMIKVIDLSISHLTIERVEKAKGKGNLTEEMSVLIDDVFPKICSRIDKYLQILSDQGLLKNEFISSFVEPRIQNQYKSLLTVYSKICSEYCRAEI